MFGYLPECMQLLVVLAELASQLRHRTSGVAHWDQLSRTLAAELLLQAAVQVAAGHGAELLQLLQLLEEDQ